MGGCCEGGWGRTRGRKMCGWEGGCHEAGLGCSTKKRTGLGRRRGRGWAGAHVNVNVNNACAYPIAWTAPRRGRSFTPGRRAALAAQDCRRARFKGLKVIKCKSSGVRMLQDHMYRSEASPLLWKVLGSIPRAPLGFEHNCR